MYKNLLLVFLCGTFIVSFSSDENIPKKNIPSLRQLAWNNIKEHSGQYTALHSSWIELIEQCFDEHESVEEDPFAYLKLAYDLKAQKQIDQGASYIADRLRDYTRLPHNDVLKFAALTRKIDELPDILSAKIWGCRNGMNDITGQSQ